MIKQLTLLLLLVIAVLFPCKELASQDKAIVDSVLNIIKTSDNDSCIIVNYTKLAAYYRKFDIKKSYKYGKKALEIAKKSKDINQILYAYRELALSKQYEGKYSDARKYYKTALKLSKKTGDSIQFAEAYNDIGLSFYYEAVYDSALEYFKKSSVIKINNNDSLGAAISFNNIGIMYDIKNKPAKSIDYYLKAVSIYEKIKNYQNLFGTYQNIALVLINQQKNEDALKYLKKALQYVDSIDKSISPANLYSNIGIVYDNLQQFDTALVYYNLSLEMARKFKIDKQIATALTNIAANLRLQKRLNESIKYLNEALAIKQKLGNKSSIAVSQVGLGEVYYMMKQYNKAIAYFLQGIENAKQTGYKMYEKQGYQGIYKAYKELGDYKNAYKYQELYMILQDSLINDKNNKIVEELQTKYETEKKEEQIKRQEAEIGKHKAEKLAQDIKLKKERTQKIALFVGLLLTIALIIVALRSIRNKKRANIALAAYLEEIKQQKEEITAQRDEIEAQRDLAATQRDLIIEQKQAITDSIQYAYKIQTAVIPDDGYMSSLLKDYFVLYKPRDIVSGDFYWLGKQNGKLIIIAADCTGHGVPGAFMSMLGFAFINDIVNKERITSPAEILNKLRKSIIKALNQHGKDDDQKDGMDAAAITIDIKNNRMQFAGANNPLYIIKNNELIEKKADKMPVSIYRVMNDFTNHDIEIQQNDVFYIFSDGYADQFGGEKGKKFKYKNFRELLLSISDKPMAEQKEILNTTFEKWKQNFDQIDDVLVMGVKI